MSCLQIKLSAWSYLEISREDEVTVRSFVIVPLKGWRSSIFGNNTNKSKFYSGINKQQIEVSECLLSFGVESIVC
jgi:hypothetical protein